MRRALLVFFVFPLLVAGIMWAQSDRGTITGTVTDPTGAVLAGVEVIATNVDTGVRQTVSTNSVGLYSVLNLQVGRYSLTFSKQGFRNLERSIIQLAVAQVAKIDVTLPIGMATELVTVTEDVPLLQTQTADVGTNLKGSVVMNLPLSVDGGRQLETFAYSTTPGVTGNAWTSSIGGSEVFTKEVLIDGTSTYAQIQGDLMESTPSMEAVQEFQVQTSGFSAENSRTGGGVFMFGLKSGTNTWHGSGFLFLHNEIFDANTWQNNDDRAYYSSIDPANAAFYDQKYRKPRARFNQYGFSFGGPVIKNKTFFFVAYENYRQKNFTLQPNSQWVPIPAFLDGNFSALLDTNTILGTDGAGQTIYKGAIFDPVTRDVFPGNIIPPERLSSVSKQIAELYRNGYTPGSSALIPNNALPASNSPRQVPYQLSIKVDHSLTDKNKLATSWIYNLRQRTLVDSGGIWAFGSEDGGPLARARQQNVVGNQWRASDTHTFTPNVLNVLSATYNEYKNASLAKASSGNWPPVLGFGDTGAGNFPEINFGDARNGIETTGIGYSSSGGYVGDTFILDDTVSWVKGRHTFKFGFDFRAMQINSSAGTGTLHFDFSPDQTGAPGAPFLTNDEQQQVGFGFASFMLGAVQKASMDTPFRLYGRRKYMAMFAQDDFRLSSRISLNYGLRWETTFPFHEKYGHWANFDLQAMNPTWGIPGTLVFAENGDTSFETNRDWKEFSPHVGAAIKVTEKLVARGSYGITYVPIGNNYWSGVPYAFAPGYRGTNNVLQNGTNPAFNWDNGYPGEFVPGTSDPNIIPWGPVNIDPDSLKAGYIHQFTIGAQYELSKDMKLDVTYIGNRGRRLHEGTLAYNEPDTTSYFNWYNTFGKNHWWDWIDSPDAAAAAGVPWYPLSLYPLNMYWGYMAYQAVAPYPQASMLYGPIFYVGTPKGRSSYNAFQVEFTKRMGRGVAANVNYTYSVSKGNTYTNFDELWYNGSFQDYSKLNQDADTLLGTDMKHFFKSYITWELPFGRGKDLLSDAGRLLNGFVGGWTASGMFRYNSGVPLTVYSTNYYPGWAGVYPNVNLGADLSSQFNAGAYNNHPDPSSPTYGNTNLYFDPQAFTNPADGELGTGRIRNDALRGFGRAYEDLGIMKNFGFGSENRFNLMFRFEMYNIFNRHYFSDPNTDMNSPTFGHVTGLSNDLPRQGQFGMRFTW